MRCRGMASWGVELRCSSPFAMWVLTKNVLSTMSFVCLEEQISPPTAPENQLGVTELQRTVKDCPDGLTM